MTPAGQHGIDVSADAKDMVMSALERNQLAGMKKQVLQKRKLTGVETAVLGRCGSTSYSWWWWSCTK